jgi:signal transduction histidine kinase
VRFAAPALHRALRHDVVRDGAADAEARAREAHRRARQHEHLMAVAGHDLRTPLQTVIMGARLVTQQGLLTPAQAVTAGRMARSAERAAGIIRDLLDLGRARQGMAVRITPRPTDLGALAAAAVVELEQAYPERVICCTVRGDAAGVWDAGRLSRVLSNLVQNALEHGGPLARVAVEVDGQADAVRLAVRHDGPPMSRERIARVLEPASGHAGLGLAIVREIVRAHGGAVAARSSPEDGTVFEVALPRQVPATAP